MRPPIFILSPPRSFTSVACAMLGNHPEMVGLPETNLFSAATIGELERTYRFRPTAEHGLLRSIAEFGLGEQNEENVDAARIWLAERKNVSTSDVFCLLGEWANDRTLIEKSPAHVYRSDPLHQMREHFPDAFYLHLTRHPQPMIQSIAKLREKIAEGINTISGRTGQSGPSLRRTELEPEKVWLEPHLRIMDFLESISPENQLRLRGEDLLTEPKSYLIQICDWLGMSTGPDALECMLHPEQSPFSRYGPDNAKYGNDPNFLEHPELRPYRYEPISLDENDKVTGRPYSELMKQCAVVLGY